MSLSLQRKLCLSLLGLGLMLLSSGAQAEDLEVRLRLAWGGGNARLWRGQVRVPGGQWTRPETLDLEGDASASLHVAGDTLHLHPGSARSFTGIDVTLRAPRESELLLELTPQDSPADGRRIQVPLLQLLDQAYDQQLDSLGNQLQIRRAPGDLLRVNFARDHLIFATGERFVFSVEPHELGALAPPDATLRVRAELHPARRDEPLWSDELELQDDLVVDLSPAEQPFQLTLPAEEGVYDLVLTLVQGRFRPRVLIERRVQLVALAPAEPEGVPAAWEIVGAIDPADKGWRDWLRMPRLPLLPDIGERPLVHGEVTTVTRGDLTWTTIAPGGWQAFPLPVDKLGRPHRLETAYPTDVPQSLGISIIDPNAAGEVVPLGVDSGIYVTQEQAEQAVAGMRRHQLVYWPRTETPFVLLTNRHPTRPAHVGRLTVSAGPDRLPARFPQPDVPQRLVAAFFDKPLFPENFSADEALDPISGRSLEDWLTFYQGAERLIQYLQYAGYNGAVISVYCEGSTLYPSELVRSTPKYDTGTFFGSGQDPVRKDVVELLFRMFDRAGLKLVPAIQFSSPLVSLEDQMRDDGPAAEGIALVGVDGQRWIDRNRPHRGLAPYYNPLDRRVQDAMRGVVEELLTRYGDHDAFGGIAVQLGPETFTQLPGEHWAHDRVTQRRFAAALEELPPAASRRVAWLHWRATVLADFYRELALAVGRERPHARLYLSGGDLFTDGAMQQMLRPGLPHRARISDALLQMGIRPDLYRDQEELVLLRPQRTAPIHRLTEQALSIRLATTPSIDEAFAAPGRSGSVFVHEPLPLLLPSFDAASPFGRERTQTWLVHHLSPAGSANRERFVHALAQTDAQTIFDGGWMLPMGQEDELASFLEAYRQLPPRPFDSPSPAATALPTQPVVVRTLEEANRTYIYVTNDSPWTVTTEIDLQASVQSRFQSLTRRPLPPPKSLGDRTMWTLALDPYEVVAAVVVGGTVRVQTWRVTVDREVYTSLRDRLLDSLSRAQRLATPRPVPVLHNPGFEGDAALVPGWTFARGPGVSVSVDRSQAYEGRQSLHLRSEGPVAWVRSHTIPAPKTGRIAVLVRLRSTDPSRLPPLRVAVEGRLHGVTYYRPAPVRNPDGIAPDWGNKPFLLPIDDLPVTGLSDLTIGFDLIGEGEVWIDDVQVFDRWFLETERDELDINIAVAANQLSEGRIADCHRFLSSYWARFLREFVPADDELLTEQMDELPDNVRREEERPAEPALPENESPSMLDRVWSRLPLRDFPF